MLVDGRGPEVALQTVESLLLMLLHLDYWRPSREAPPSFGPDPSWLCRRIDSICSKIARDHHDTIETKIRIFPAPE